MEENVLSELDPTRFDIPIRLDFFMSDVEKDIIGFKNQVTTDVDGVHDILSDILSSGITNVNTGLLGWADGGVTLGDPRDTDFTREIGRKRDFEDLISYFGNQNVDISFAQDYYLINEEIMFLRRNASQHISSWYSRVDTYNYPIWEFYFARPERSVKWLRDQSETFLSIGATSLTINGISNNLTSDETTNVSRTEAKNMIVNAFGDLHEEAKINAYQPNAYLWSHVDRYLGAPVYGSQFLIETDTVPFLQLVLQNTMEIYGPYSNFSFYTTSDILRMVDYNVFPSFVLTDKPAYLLTDTNSRNYYSTEYDLYKELIDQIYTDVNYALQFTIGANWVDREVLENGVIVNSYDNGIKIVINYTEDFIVYDEGLIAPLSYRVVGDGNAA